MPSIGGRNIKVIAFGRNSTDSFDPRAFPSVAGNPTARISSGSAAGAAVYVADSRAVDGSFPSTVSRNRIDEVERLLLVGEFRIRRAISIRFPGATIGRRRKRRDRSRADIFGRIEIELHQRHMLAIAIALEEPAGELGRLRIDGSPARKARSQYLKRQYRFRYPHKPFVRLLRATRC